MVLTATQAGTISVLCMHCMPSMGAKLLLLVKVTGGSRPLQKEGQPSRFYAFWTKAIFTCKGGVQPFPQQCFLIVITVPLCSFT